jgi:hypothetical protein
MKIPVPALLAAAVLGATVAACLGPTTHSTSPSPRCPLDARLVPRCGALIGVTPPAPSLATLESVESRLAHRFELVYSFHDINDVVPSAFDRAVVARGSLLHLTIDSRDYASADRSTAPWSAVAAGQYDAGLTRQAQGIAALGAPVFVTFDHEPDQPARSTLGTPTEFVAAWRHVHDLFVNAGADNAVWVWVVTGWAGSFTTALQMWPGNDDVDWISWEAYDRDGCQDGTSGGHRSFAQAALPFLGWIRAHGPAAGIDVSKPMMISEAGTARPPTGPTADPAWYAAIPAFLRRHPQIRAVTLWDHTGSTPGCDYRFAETPPTNGAVAGLIIALTTSR